jgi:hypothetical protein
MEVLSNEQKAHLADQIRTESISAQRTAGVPWKGMRRRRGRREGKKPDTAGSERDS